MLDLWEKFSILNVLLQQLKCISSAECMSTIEHACYRNLKVVINMNYKSLEYLVATETEKNTFPKYNHINLTLTQRNKMLHVSDGTNRRSQIWHFAKRLQICYTLNFYRLPFCRFPRTGAKSSLSDLVPPVQPLQVAQTNDPSQK